MILDADLLSGDSSGGSTLPLNKISLPTGDALATNCELFETCEPALDGRDVFS